jgi:hypothetical protein
MKIKLITLGICVMSLPLWAVRSEPISVVAVEDDEGDGAVHAHAAELEAKDRAQNEAEQIRQLQADNERLLKANEQFENTVEFQRQALERAAEVPAYDPNRKYKPLFYTCLTLLVVTGVSWYWSVMPEKESRPSLPPVDLMAVELDQLSASLSAQRSGKKPI